MGFDNLKHIAGSIEVNQNLRSLDLQQNNLKKYVIKSKVLFIIQVSVNMILVIIV